MYILVRWLVFYAVNIAVNATILWANVSIPLPSRNVACKVDMRVRSHQKNMDNALQYWRTH